MSKYRTNKLIKRSFTLIEVLVASSVLFIVSAAVVGLSNSIIQGTSVTADTASANRLATEGLELITKIRDDKVKNADFRSGVFIWFDQVEESSDYGWYKLEKEEFPFGNTDWQLTRETETAYGNIIDLTEFDVRGAEKIRLGLIDYYRLICVEAIAAENDQDDSSLNCNTVSGGEVVNDGVRDVISACYTGSSPGDIFCKFTKDSLNKNRLGTDKKIPDGNAVKIRSVVLWNDRDVYRTTEISTILTNWQSFAQ